MINSGLAGGVITVDQHQFLLNTDAGWCGGVSSIRLTNNAQVLCVVLDVMKRTQPPRITIGP